MSNKNAKHSLMQTLKNNQKPYPHKEYLFLENEKYSLVTNITEKEVRIGLAFPSSDKESIDDL